MDITDENLFEAFRYEGTRKAFREKEKKVMKKVFLGGTCNESKWRETLVKNLDIEYFNPVVDDWTPDCMTEEIRQRSFCDFVLYVITPKMSGTYAIAEVVDDSNKRPEKTIFCFLKTDDGISFTPGQVKSLEAIGRLVFNNGGEHLPHLESVANYLNAKG